MSSWLAGALQTLGIEALERPVWLLLIPVTWVVVVVMSRAQPVSIAWPGLDEARLAGARRTDFTRGVALGLRALALAALALVLAGPVGVHRAPPEPGHGLDLVA